MNAAAFMLGFLCGVVALMAVLLMLLLVADRGEGRP